MVFFQITIGSVIVIIGAGITVFEIAGIQVAADDITHVGEFIAGAVYKTQLIHAAKAVAAQSTVLPQLSQIAVGIVFRFV